MGERSSHSLLYLQVLPNTGIPSTRRKRPEPWFMGYFQGWSQGFGRAQSPVVRRPRGRGGGAVKTEESPLPALPWEAWGRKESPVLVFLEFGVF